MSHLELHLDDTIVHLTELQGDVCMTTDPNVLDITCKTYSSVYVLHEDRTRQEFGSRIVHDVYESAGDFWYFQLSEPPSANPLSLEKLRADIDYLMLCQATLSADGLSDLGIEENLTDEG